jgi:hypothetical protein
MGLLSSLKKWVFGGDEVRHLFFVFASDFFSQKFDGMFMDHVDVTTIVCHGVLWASNSSAPSYQRFRAV